MAIILDGSLLFSYGMAPGIYWHLAELNSFCTHRQNKLRINVLYTMVYLQKHNEVENETII